MRLPFALCLGLITTLSHAVPEEADWLDLLPPEDLDAMLAMPEIGHDDAEGESTFYTPSGLKQQPGLPAVMYSTRTVADLNSQPLTLVGYPVPLAGKPGERLQRFFLLPYPGSCNHVPPPPPNQIVLVRYPRGFSVADHYVPLRVSGTLKIEALHSAQGDAAYALDADSVGLIEEGGD